MFITAALGCVVGWWSMKNVRLDAIPDLSETQVIVLSRWDRSPDILEDQVTYPIVTAMLGAPKVKTVRGVSDFGYSFVYVVFEDGTDIYWARSRTVEYLSTVLPSLPQGVKTEIGPDATGLGWVFQYALVDTSGNHDLSELRSYQDWYLRFHLKSVPGVAEVASLGGFTKQYQVKLDPNRLQAYGISVTRVVDAVRAGNNDAGGRLLEFGGTEYMVRGRGYARSVEDFEKISVADEKGTSIRIKDLGQVSIGPDMRRGIADLDGNGEVVSGIVVMRQGENALEVIDRVREKIRQIEPGLPTGVRIVPVYDRSDLIRRSIGNVETTLLEIIITVVLIILIFLWHFPSAIIPIVTIPVAVLIAFIPFRAFGITANIMSLAGLAIAFGELVDAAIVVVEQAHKKLEDAERSGSETNYADVVLAAVKEVGPPTFFALLVIAVSFLPVLTLQAQEGRMFKPLAYAKSLSMLIAAVLAITLDPALRLWLMRSKSYNFRPRWLSAAVNAMLVGRIRPQEKHPISRILIRAYEPVVRWSLRWKWAVLTSAALLIVATIPIYMRLGSEFMPPLDEGSLLYMPSTMPGVSISEAQKLLQVSDRIIMQFPEVQHVIGKAGRADTPTDPAPLSMLETVIVLKPKAEWRRNISSEQLVNEMNAALKLPGVSNSWTMPIRGRIEMLSTGMRTNVGLKISGGDLKTIGELGRKAEAVLAAVPGTRSVFSERVDEGYFLDIDWDRDELARYGLTIGDAQVAVQNAIGGENVGTIIHGRERYPVNVRYMRDFRSDITSLGRVLVSGSEDPKQVPLSSLAGIHPAGGPSMIRDEDGLLTGYIYIDVAGRDPNGYVGEAAERLKQTVPLPPGYAMFWTGQYQASERAHERLRLVIPLTFALIFLLLFLNTRSLVKTLIIVLAVPFSAIGAVWFLYLLGYNMSIAVWVGLIALLGVDAETGVFMLLYLDLAYEHARINGRLTSLDELRQSILNGAARRIRPKFMTVCTMALGLIPIMWSVGAGADTMKRIAAPMIGGIFSSFLLELIVYPVIYEIWKWNSRSPAVTR